MFRALRSIGSTALCVILAGSLASCATTEEMAELRKQVERAESTAAEARAMAADTKAMAADTKARVERAEAERAAAERAAAERAAAERAAAEKAAAEAKEMWERAAAERVAAERAAEERAAAGRQKSPLAAPAPAPWGGQALYEQALDLDSEGQHSDAARMYGRAARSGSGRAALRLAESYEARQDAASRRWYNVARILGEDVPSSKIGPPAPGESLYEEALTLETRGRGPDAVRVYVRAARSGNGMAALRLGEIYDAGIAGVSRDYAESLKWYNAARVLGEDLPLARTR